MSTNLIRDLESLAEAPLTVEIVAAVSAPRRKVFDDRDGEAWTIRNCDETRRFHLGTQELVAGRRAPFYERMKSEGLARRGSAQSALKILGKPRAWSGPKKFDLAWCGRSISIAEHDGDVAFLDPTNDWLVWIFYHDGEYVVPVGRFSALSLRDED
ncbi:MAG: hypothetical protein U0271_16085 [Polyangiaceae bacterium]